MYPLNEASTCTGILDISSGVVFLSVGFTWIGLLVEESLSNGYLDEGFTYIGCLIEEGLASEGL